MCTESEVLEHSSCNQVIYILPLKSGHANDSLTVIKNSLDLNVWLALWPSFACTQSVTRAQGSKEQSSLLDIKGISSI